MFMAHFQDRVKTKYYPYTNLLLKTHLISQNPNNASPPSPRGIIQASNAFIGYSNQWRRRVECGYGVQLVTLSLQFPVWKSSKRYLVRVATMQHFINPPVRGTYTEACFQLTVNLVFILFLPFTFLKVTTIN